jgi:hypothetical protein
MVKVAKLGVLTVLLGTWAVAGCVVGQADDGEEAHCAALCMSGADLQADLSADFDGTADAAFEVCRNDECYQGMMTDGRWALSTPTPPGGHVSLFASNGKVHLSWYEPGNVEGYVDGDRYRATVGALVVLDQNVSYETQSRCCGTTRVGAAFETNQEPGGN